jgi:hypothetical protein
MGMGRDAVELKTAGAWKSVVAEQWSAVLRRWQVLRGAPETWEAPRLIPCRGQPGLRAYSPRRVPRHHSEGGGANVHTSAAGQFCRSRFPRSQNSSILPAKGRVDSPVSRSWTPSSAFVKSCLSSPSSVPWLTVTTVVPYSTTAMPPRWTVELRLWHLLVSCKNAQCS